MFQDSLNGVARETKQSTTALGLVAMIGVVFSLRCELARAYRALVLLVREKLGNQLWREACLPKTARCFALLSKSWNLVKALARPIASSLLCFWRLGVLTPTRDSLRLGIVNAASLLHILPRVVCALTFSLSFASMWLKPVGAGARKVRRPFLQRAFVLSALTSFHLRSVCHSQASI